MKIIKLMMVMLVIVVLSGGTFASAQTVNISENADVDVWHYWIAADPAGRLTGPSYILNANYDASTLAFDKRDGVDVFIFSPELPANISDNFKITSASLRVSASATATWAEPGSTTNSYNTNVSIDLFAAGFGPSYDEATWDGTQPYIGSGNSGPVNLDRDPYPIDLATGGSAEENITTATVWASGIPIGYTPGAMSEAFPINFQFDVSNSAIRQELRNDLINGKSSWILSVTYDATQGGGTNYPDIVMTEGVASHAGSFAPILEIEIEDAPVFRIPWKLT